MLNSMRLPGHSSVPGDYINFFATVTAGFSILGIFLEDITYSFEVCRSLKEIYTIPFPLSRPKLIIVSVLESMLSCVKVKVKVSVLL